MDNAIKYFEDHIILFRPGSEHYQIYSAAITALRAQAERENPPVHFTGTVEDAKYSYQRIMRVRPIERRQMPDGLKYSCPVCDAVDNRHQLSYGLERCPLCNVNLCWDNDRPPEGGA